MVVSTNRGWGPSSAASYVSATRKSTAATEPIDLVRRRKKPTLDPLSSDGS